MGLRVYPAAFDGHEMTLVEGGNGSLVAWDDSLIADRLRADIAMGLLKNPHQETGRAMADGPFREALANLYQRIRK